MAGEDLTGRRLGGFELIEPLGEGSFGSVWRARQLRLDRDVAVKILDPLVARDPNAARRFEREGRAAASLDHPSIVPVYEAGDDDGLYFLAMRLVDGGTLADVMTSAGPMTVDDTADLLAPIGSALDAAHATGLIHRDVKPANIIIEDGRPFLTDFGIAASARELGRYTTGSIGTAEYMAPEQGRGDAVDHRADLYALGCVAFHALTGATPFARDDMVSTLMAHATEDVPTSGDEGFDAFFARALAKEPDDRFDSAAELIDALRSASDGGAALPPSVGSSRAGEADEDRRIAGRVYLVGLVIAAVAATVVGVAVSLGGGDDGPETVEAGDDGSPPATTEVADAEGEDDSLSLPGPVAEVAPGLRDGGSVVVGTTLLLDDPNPHSNLDVSPLLAEWVLPVMYRIDERRDPVPSLATGPPVAAGDDPLRLTWELRDDRVWSDGEQVTTADVVATFEYLTATDTNAVNTQLYADVDTVTAVDDTTLELELTAPIGAAHLLFSTIHPIIKASAWTDHLAAGGTAADFLVDGVDFAAGPFQLAARQNTGEIALSRNPGWNGETVPALDRVVFATYADGDALVAAQAAREVDMIWVDSVGRTELLDAAAIPDTVVAVGSSDLAVQLTMNLRNDALTDPRVREAILLALDRPAIADVAVGRKTDTIAEPWNSLVFGPGQAGSTAPFSGELDLARANQLLDEAGWTRPDETVFRRRDGQDLALGIVLLNDADSINTVLAIEEALQGIGIDITGLPAGFEITNDRINTGDFDLLLQFRILNNDPVATAFSFGTDFCPPTVPGCTGDVNGVNVGAVSDADLDAAFGVAAQTTDLDERAVVYAGIDERLRELVVAVPLYVEPSFTAHSIEIGGVTVAPSLGPIVSLDEWGLLTDG
ncbi:MAG: ABC transporter substrate-binding protein [Actinomycetota bacterium]